MWSINRAKPVCKADSSETHCSIYLGQLDELFQQMLNQAARLTPCREYVRKFLEKPGAPLRIQKHRNPLDVNMCQIVVRQGAALCVESVKGVGVRSVPTFDFHVGTSY